jgi:hypothetical protein
MKTFPSLLVIAITGVCFASDGYITGRVTDTQGDPVEGMYVFAADYADDLFAGNGNSGTDGYYTIGPIPAGTYRVQVDAWGTEYVNRQYYSGKSDYNQADPVCVTKDQTTTEIDFELELGASIEGYVYDPHGTGLSGVEVDMYSRYFDFGASSVTDSNGYYKIYGLPFGGVYTSSCRPFGYDDLQITAHEVYIQSPVLYSGHDFNLVGGAFYVSGIVYDKASSLPVEGVYVGSNIRDINAYGGHCQTNADGYYILKNLPQCDELDLWVNTAGTAYAQVGAETSVYGNIENMDFALTTGAAVNMQVVDIATGEPLPGVEVTCDNEYYQSWSNAFSDIGGWAAMEQVPGGVCEITARPPQESGYCWSYNWPQSMVYLPGDEDTFSHIAVQKGAMITGRFIDAASNPLSGIEFEWIGETCGGWTTAAADGTFSLRLPLGLSTVGCDEDEFFCEPVLVNVSDVNTSVNIGDITVYDSSSCEFISGSVTAPSGWPQQGELEVISFEPGTFIDADSLAYISPVSEAPLEPDGSFALPVVPGKTFDVYLVLIEEIEGSGVETVIVKDSALASAASSTGVLMTFVPQNNEVAGSVQNTAGLPVMSAYAVLTHSATGQLAGFCSTDKTGGFRIYSISDGNYDLTLSHPAYQDYSETVTLSGSAMDVGIISIAHNTSRYGNDLNGDGCIKIEDFAFISWQWLDNYGKDDLYNLSSSWLLKNYWFND